ncbi:MAG TPA: AI-2E family transporter YdiK [Phycisphaerae bacterium]|nr:AI-2E family transporter YdiK [Phycisphaerae bacterium]
MRDNTPPEITRITLQVLSIGLLIGGAFWILQFFIPSILWATIIVITTWPLFQLIQRRLWNKRALAILVMVGALLLIVILPCAVAIGSIIMNTEKITAWGDSLRQMEMPPPPGFLANIPMIGPRLIGAWQKGGSLTAEGLSKHLAPYTGTLVSWFISKAGSVGLLLVHFLFTLIFAIVLYANGEAAGEAVRAFCRRLAGQRGDEIATLSAKAIRSVALGVIVTALVQAVLSGIGLAVSGVPSPGLLTAIIFVSCLCQIGPGIILIPAIVWLYWRGGLVSGSVLLVFAVIILPLDNFLRPILIRKGADMPLILVFIGVIGGLIAMGVIGLFIGPVILAVANTLLKSWIRDVPAGEQNP